MADTKWPEKVNSNTILSLLNAEITRATTAETNLQTEIDDATSNIIIYPAGAADNFSVDTSGNLTVSIATTGKVSNGTNLTINAGTYTNSTGSTSVVYIMKDGAISAVTDGTKIAQGTYIVAWVREGVVSWPTAGGGGEGDVTKDELTAAINTESTARQAADTNLQLQIDTNTASINQNATNITGEVERAKAAESANAAAITLVQQGLDTEEAARADAVSKLNTTISNVKEYSEEATTKAAMWLDADGKIPGLDPSNNPTNTDPPITITYDSDTSLYTIIFNWAFVVFSNARPKGVNAGWREQVKTTLPANAMLAYNAPEDKVIIVDYTYNTLIADFENLIPICAFSYDTSKNQLDYIKYFYLDDLIAQGNAYAATARITSGSMSIKITDSAITIKTGTTVPCWSFIDAMQGKVDSWFLQQSSTFTATASTLTAGKSYVMSGAFAYTYTPEFNGFIGYYNAPILIFKVSDEGKIFRAQTVVLVDGATVSIS